MSDQTIKFDADKPKLHLVPFQICTDIAIVREYGNKKYSDPDSWRRVEMERFIDAHFRHMFAFAEDYFSVDKESGIDHYMHGACNLAFISDMMARKKRERGCGGTDGQGF